MRTFDTGPLLICCLALVPVAFPSEGSARLEKVAEGQYMEWQDGHPLEHTAQSWTMWRTDDGFEIEDSLPVEQGELMMALLGAEPKAPMSRELREEIKNLTMKTNITLHLTKEKAIQVLVVNGKNIHDAVVNGKNSNDAGQVEVANCQFKGEKIECKGHDTSLRLKNASQDQLLYLYPFPLLFTQVLTQSHTTPVQTNAVTLALLEEVNSKYQLTRVSGQLRDEGPESFVIGDKKFVTNKLFLKRD